MIGQTLAEIQRAGATDVVLPQKIHLGPEAVIGFGEFILRLKVENQRHQGFGHEAPAEIAETAVFIGAGFVGIDQIVRHLRHLHSGQIAFKAYMAGGKAKLLVELARFRAAFVHCQLHQAAPGSPRAGFGIGEHRAPQALPPH